MKTVHCSLLTIKEVIFIPAKVSIVKTPDYNLDNIQNAVNRHFEYLKFDEKIKPGARVTLKPNLLMKRKPSDWTTTHPGLVEAVAIKLKELGVTDITIADSPGGPYTAGLLKGLYNTTGMTEIAQRQGIKLNLDVGYTEKECPSHELVKKFNIINPLAEADIIINLPKLKTHSMTGLSGSIKNMFGSIPGLAKPEMHWRFPDDSSFSNMLVDLALTVPPTFTIVDAVVAMEGDGPSSGNGKEIGYTYASDNVFALDMLLCNVINIPYDRIGMVKCAAERNLAPQFSDIELVGDDFAAFKDYKHPRSKNMDVKGFFMPKSVEKLLLSPKPKIVKKQCIGCGKCAESCPAKTIDIQSGKAVIDYTKCIKCYCCHEMCPVKAIKIQRWRIFNI